jgi:polyisoprenoid-binding protein YceI
MMLHRKTSPALLLVLACWLTVSGTANAADTYVADPVHSSLIFRIKHLRTSNFWGRFNYISGAFALDDANPAASQFSFEVKADSVDTANGKRDAHIKSPDFLNVVQYPTISFQSQSVTKSGAAYQVTGDLTLHGVTKSITVEVTPSGSGKDQMGNAIAGIAVGFGIKRSDFGMTTMVGPLSDEVWITAGIEGKRK